jgi:hypothetical protein
MQWEAPEEAVSVTETSCSGVTRILHAAREEAERRDGRTVESSGRRTGANDRVCTHTVKFS